MWKLWIVVAVAVLAVAGCDRGGGEEGAATAGAAGGAAPAAVTVESADGEARQAVASLAPVGAHIVRTGALELSLAPGKLDEAVDRARTTAAGLGGFVASSAETRAGAAERRASLVLRVPSDSYARAVASLSRLGRIERREETGEDVTGETVDLEARVRHLEAVERQLLELLDRANTVAEALAVRSELDGVQLELEQTQGRLRYLADRVSYATVSLELVERPVAGGGGKGGGGIWDDAAERFLAVAGGLLVGLAAAGPILLIAALAFLGVRLWWTRRPQYHASK
jgi:hypothetical protein